MENKELPKFNELKVLMLRNGDTYDTLASYAGCSKGTISRKIMGKQLWTWKEMQKIRLHYSLTNDEFMSIFFK